VLSVPPCGRPLRLGHLLILPQLPVPQPDREEGLDAGSQVEGFAGPAGSDGLGVRVVEAVHLSKSMTLGR
jgi:hypothetical protein